VSDAETPFGVALAQLAAAAPDRPAITHEDRTVSRGELERRTNRLARAYARLGVRPDSFVTIALPNGIAFFEAAIAAWKLGATPQPISPRLPVAERRAILELAAPALVVGVDPSEVPGRPAVPAGFEPETALADDPLPPVVPASWKAPTSGGSTGRPKLIVATQPGTLEAIAPFYRLTPRVDEGVGIVTGPLSHNGPFTTACVGLLMGVHQVVMTRFDAAKALELIERYRVDWMYAVPTMMLRIWRLPESERRARDLSSLVSVLHMAAPCPPWLKQGWIDWLGPDRIWELYGGTEAQAFTVINGHQWLAHRGSVGRPSVGEIRVLDVAGHACPPGEVGEVWMRRGEGAPPVYRYIGAEAKTRDGWESLGDMGWMDAEGYLYLTDRDTDMILVGGANVYPAEVEAALEEHPAVRGSCVIGLPDEDLGNVVHAIVQADREVGDAELLAHLRERLAPYKLPRSFERVSEPLRDDAGKVRRSALRTARVGAGPPGGASLLRSNRSPT
jgi:bile acid-coenzyme A ligase